MNAQPNPSAAAEINRLHGEVQRCAAVSKKALGEALVAAWQAGQLLAAERQRVNHTMGRAWHEWLRVNFRGSARTAQRYLRLAASVSDPAFLRGLSLRQAYHRLGIATEPKVPRLRVALLPDYIRLAERLACSLKRNRPSGPAAAARLEAYRRDLRALYEQLRELFAPSNPAVKVAPHGP